MRDRLTGTVVRASRPRAGGQPDGQAFGPMISADGRHVAFLSDAANLVPHDTNSVLDVFIRDLG